MEEKLLPAEEEGAEKNLPLATKNDLNKSASQLPLFAGFNLARLKGKANFGEAEKLKSKKLIGQLFEEGKSVAQGGFTLVYLPLPLKTLYPVQAGFVVPKRFFKRAVDRNRIKRLMREAYRLNKFDFYKSLAGQQQIALMFVYNGRKIPEYAATIKAVTGCMKKIAKV